MADDFQGRSAIVLQPLDSSAIYRFNVTIASSSTKNDGAIPYDWSVHKHTITIHRSDGSSDATSVLIADTTRDGNVLVEKLSGTTVLSGLYHMRFKVTITQGATTDLAMVREFDFNRLQVKNR